MTALTWLPALVLSVLLEAVVAWPVLVLGQPVRGALLRPLVINALLNPIAMFFLQPKVFDGDPWYSAAVMVVAEGALYRVFLDPMALGRALLAALAANGVAVVVVPVVMEMVAGG